MDLDQGASSLAYADSASEIRAICNGPNGTLYSVGHSSLSGSEVSILDCSQVQFVLLQKYPVVPDFKANNVCYLRSSGKIYLGSENESKICAMEKADASCKLIPVPEKKLWKTTFLRPINQLDVVLIGNQSTKEFLVLDGISGQILQTLKVDGSGYTNEVHVHDDSLITRRKRNPVILSLYVSQLFYIL